MGPERIPRPRWNEDAAYVNLSPSFRFPGPLTGVPRLWIGEDDTLRICPADEQGTPWREDTEQVRSVLRLDQFGMVIIGTADEVWIMTAEDYASQV